MKPMDDPRTAEQKTKTPKQTQSSEKIPAYFSTSLDKNKVYTVEKGDTLCYNFQLRGDDGKILDWEPIQTHSRITTPQGTKLQTLDHMTDRNTGNYGGCFDTSNIDKRWPLTMEMSVSFSDHFKYRDVQTPFYTFKIIEKSNNQPNNQTQPTSKLPTYFKSNYLKEETQYLSYSDEICPSIQLRSSAGYLSNTEFKAERLEP